jgi:hypothetical protein
MALDIAEKLHSMDYSKEIVKATMLTGEIAFKQAQTNIMELADNIWWHMYNIACVPDISEDRYSIDEKIAIMKKSIDMLSVIFDGDFKYYNDRIANSYRQLAMLYLVKGDRDAAVECVELMAKYAVDFDTADNGSTYSSLILNTIGYEKSEGVTLCEKLLRGRFATRIWAPIRNDERFVAAVEAMEKQNG